MTGLVGTATLVRLALRRDRIRLLVWIMLAIGLVAGTVSSVSGLYADPAQRQRYADMAGTDAASAMFGGPRFGSATLGGVVVMELGATLTILVVLLSMLFVIRHTRAEEETGRAELVASAVVGRHARLAAALLGASGTNLVIAAGTVAVMIGNGLPAAGSLAFGLGVALTGTVFATVAGVIAQCVTHARTANGSSAAVFGLAFVVRGIGDASATADGGAGPLRWLSWLSPVGWAQQVRAFAGERWWVLALLVGAIALLAGAAVALSRRRDFAAGLIPARPGPAGAAPGLAGPGALAWRLHRGTLFGWVVGVTGVAALLSVFAEGIADRFGDNAELVETMARLGGAGALADSYLGWLLGAAGIAASAYGVGAVLRMRAEEAGLRAEPVLATAVSRWRWLAGHLAVAVGGVAGLLVTTGLAVGLVHGLRTGSVADQLPRMLAGALVRIPAALILVAVAVALFAAVPRFSSAAWLCVVLVGLMAQLGEVLQLDRWVLAVSPFDHLPKVPGAEITATPLIWLSGIALLLTALGVGRFRTRDIG